MISKLAKDYFKDLQAQGLNPTLEDFDRLNQIALRLVDGAETTCANFPRVGWAGDVPFYEPTLQAFAWYHGFAVRYAKNEETENTFWAFALAHAREPGYFRSLETPEAIEKAVGEWAAALPVTCDEIFRACRYAARGFDDAEPGRPDDSSHKEQEIQEGASPASPALCGQESPRHRADKSAAAKNLENVERILAKACAALHATPDALMHETPTRLDRLCEAAAVELGRPMTRDEARLQADYDLTLREITLRLMAEKEAADNGK